MAEKGNKKNIRIHLNGVRASYMHVFKKQAYKDNDPKYSCRFIIDPKTKSGKAALDEINDAIDTIIDETFNGKEPKNIYVLEKGDRDREETDGMWVVGSSNQNRPKVLDRDKTPLDSEDGRPYSGCYVNAIIDVYGSKEYKSIQASLMGIQFLRDGEPFGGGHISDDEFEEVDDEDDEGGSRKRGGSSKRSRDDDDDERPSNRDRGGRGDKRGRDSDDDRPSRSKRSRDDDDDSKDDDEPPRRKRSRDEDDDEPRRSGGRSTRSSRDDEDDEKPRRRNRDFD